MTYTIKLSELFATGHRFEVSRTIFDPEKVARLLGFDVEMEGGFVAHASFAGKEIAPQTMHGILENLAYHFYDHNDRQLKFDGLPFVDILRLLHIEVVDDVNAEPRALKANELSLSALLACGGPYRVSRVYLDADKAARTLGFEEKPTTAGMTPSVFFRGTKINWREWCNVYRALRNMYFDNLTGECQGLEEFVKLMKKYDVKIADDVSRTNGQNVTPIMPVEPTRDEEVLWARDRLMSCKPVRLD